MDKIKLTTFRNPFKPGDREIKSVDLIPDANIQDYVKQIELPQENGIEYAVSYNGALVPVDRRAEIIPRHGDWIAICPVVHGGGNNGKSPLALILGIALSVVAMGVGSMMMGGSFMGAGFIAPAAWSSWGAYLAAAAVMAVGGALISSMVGIQSIDIDTRSSTQTYSWSTMTSLTGQGGCVMITYGTIRTAGQILAEHITSDGEKQYYNVLLCGGEGPLDSISGIQINGNDIANYNGIDRIYKIFMILF